MAAQIITAPNDEMNRYIPVFLAGGITNCKDWQSKVIEELIDEKITIYNPRRKYFNITDKNISYEQIEWEFRQLECMDIFSMYFCGGDSIQPICMYELGRNIIRMQNRFPSDWEKRIVISCEVDYIRKEDVIIQTELATHNKVFVEHNATPELHAQYIKRAIRNIKNNTQSL